MKWVIICVISWIIIRIISYKYIRMVDRKARIKLNDWENKHFEELLKIDKEIKKKNKKEVKENVDIIPS